MRIMRAAGLLRSLGEQILKEVDSQGVVLGGMSLQNLPLRNWREIMPMGIGLLITGRKFGLMRLMLLLGRRRER